MHFDHNKHLINRNSNKKLLKSEKINPINRQFAIINFLFIYLKFYYEQNGDRNIQRLQ